MTIRNPRPDPVDIPRSSLAEDSLAEYVIPMDRIYSEGGGGFQFSQADQLVLDTAAAAPSFGPDTDPILTSRIKTGTASAGGEDASGEFAFPLPPEFVSGGTLKIRLWCQYNVEGGPNVTASTIDAFVYPLDDTGDLGADAVTTTIETITSSWDDYDFTVGGSYDPGDMFRCRFTEAVAEAGGGGGVFGQVAKVSMLLDIKG